jgi:hypothetical protein
MDTETTETMKKLFDITQKLISESVVIITDLIKEVSKIIGKRIEKLESRVSRLEH